MNMSNLIAVAVACVLTACATRPEPPKPPVPAKRDMQSDQASLGFDPLVTLAPTPCNIDVFFEDDLIQVNQEPAPTRRCVNGNMVTLSWNLSRHSVYTFPANGITFKGFPVPSKVVCDVTSSSRKVFQCTFDRPARGTRYNYSITILQNGVALPPLDPTIFAN
jgi:hypothetical protein